MRLKVLLISSGQPSTNPRLVKEAIAFANIGCIVKVIYCHVTCWADRFDDEIISTNGNIQWIRVGTSKLDNSLLFLLFRIRKKVWTIVYENLGDILGAALKSSVLFSQELRNAALKQRADIYIGHNLGAIRAVIDASKKYSAKRYFDFEDFHRGEDLIDSLHWNRVETIEKKYIPKLNGAWAASALITQEYSKNFPNLSIVTINNCFPKKYKIEKLKNIPGPELKMFWFSQTIGKNRGLEQIIQSIGKLRNKAVNLTLLGNCTNELKSYFNCYAEANGVESRQITFLNPVREIDIVRIASEYHIGIASEPGINTNNGIALSNKIFTYLLAGNAILFSNTLAQEEFATENSNIGLIYPIGDIDSLARCINLYFQNRELLNEHRSNSLELSNKLNWETEIHKLFEFLNLK